MPLFYLKIFKCLFLFLSSFNPASQWSTSIITFTVGLITFFGRLPNMESVNENWDTFSKYQIISEKKGVPKCTTRTDRIAVAGTRYSNLAALRTTQHGSGGVYAGEARGCMGGGYLSRSASYASVSREVAQFARLDHRPRTVDRGCPRHSAGVSREQKQAPGGRTTPRRKGNEAAVQRASSGAVHSDLRRGVIEIPAKRATTTGGMSLDVFLFFFLSYFVPFHL